MKFKKFISVALAAAIASSTFSVIASAEEKTTEQPSIETTETEISNSSSEVTIETDEVNNYPKNGGSSITKGDFTYELLDDGTFSVVCNNDNITNAVIPSTVNGKKVTVIGNNAFKNCKSLSSVTIPNTVKSIWNSAFYNCISLSKITIPSSVNYIGSYSFQYCISLESVVIPNSVTSIGYEAFQSCQSLASLTIGSGVSEMGSYAFADCPSLAKVVITNGTSIIGEGAFQNCTALKTIAMPDSVKTLSPYAFQKCTSLETVKLSNNIDCISYNAFQDCINLKSITFPKSLATVGDYAFQRCKNLESAVDLSNVSYIGYEAFEDCDRITTVTIGSKLNQMKEYAFNSCDSLSNIKLNGTPFIGAYAFQKCTALKSITIPGSVKDIGKYAFSNCSSLTNVKLCNGIQTISYDAFYNCISLSSIVIPDSVVWIGSEAFRYCSSLTSAKIGSGVITIYSYAFSNCENLTSLEIGENVVTIKDNAFNKCYKLKNVTIPNSVVTIEYEVFDNCTSLLSVIIPKTVKQIGKNVFHNNPELNDVYYKGSKDQWDLIEIGNNEQLDVAEIHYNYKPAVSRLTNMKATPSSNSIKLTFDKFYDTDYYSVGLIQNGKWVKEVCRTSDNTSSINITGLNPNTSYTFRVIAKQNDLTLATADITSKTLISLANLKASATNNSVTLKWDKNTSAAYYRVFVIKNGSWSKLTQTANNSTVSYTASNLKSNNPYKFRVAAYNKSGTCLAYSDINVKTLGTMSNLKTSTTNNSVTFNWGKNTDASYYRVFVIKGGKWTTLTKTANNSTLTYTASNLKSNNPYKFRVAAYNKNGSLMAYTDLGVKTLGTMANLKASTTNNSVKLTWDKNTSASYYRIFIIKGGKWTTLTKTANNSTLTYTASNLKSNNAYKFRVSAYDKNGVCIAYSDIGIKTK